MRRPVAYQGEEQYIFISYSHKDADRVLPVIAQMQRDGFRVWYDEGITPGDEWDDNIADHLAKCAFFIPFLSQDYLDSENCKDELFFAYDLRKPAVMVYLESVKLPRRMEFRAGRSAELVADGKGRFLRKLYRTPEITDCHKSAPKLRRGIWLRRTASAVLALLLVLTAIQGIRQIDFVELQDQIEEYLHPKVLQESVLLRKDGLKVIARGISLAENGDLQVQFLMENTTDQVQWIYFDSIEINGVPFNAERFRLYPGALEEKVWTLTDAYLTHSGLAGLRSATDVKVIEAVLRFGEEEYETNVRYYPYGEDHALAEK